MTKKYKKKSKNVLKKKKEPKRTKKKSNLKIKKQIRKINLTYGGAIVFLIVLIIIIYTIPTEQKQNLSQEKNISTLKTEAINFFQEYWYLVLIALGVFGFGGFFGFKQFKLKKLKKQIIGLRTEKKTILELMKTAKSERFRENKISPLVYNMRMQKYGGKITKIKQELPALEIKLKQDKFI